MASHRRELSKKVCYFFKGEAMASHRRELSKKVCVSFFLKGGQWPAIEGNFQRRCVSFFFF